MRLGLLGVLGVILLVTPVLAPAQVPDAVAPNWRNDPSWPKPFPNNWVIGAIGGLFVDERDHIWVLQRQVASRVEANGQRVDIPPDARMPAVLEFDAAGNLLSSWGRKGYTPDWPLSEHGLWVDRGGNVWLGGNAPGDRHLLKFTRDGKPLMRIGRPTTAPRNNQDTTMLGQPADIGIDEAAREIYIADGYLNNRIVVYDSVTGAFKRGWGAYGIPLSQVVNAPEPSGDEASTATRYIREKPDYVPGEKPAQFRTPVHCVRLSNDGLVYVCDRRNDRIQVFTKEGKFVREFSVHPETLANGAVWMLSFSRDPGQRYLLAADGINQRVWVLRRSDGVEMGSFAQGGFLHTVHQAGLDSKGDYYTGDVGGIQPGAPVMGNGKSIQKFTLEPRR